MSAKDLPPETYWFAAIGASVSLFAISYILCLGLKHQSSERSRQAWAKYTTTRVGKIYKCILFHYLCTIASCLLIHAVLNSDRDMKTFFLSNSYIFSSTFYQISVTGTWLQRKIKYTSMSSSLLRYLFWLLIAPISGVMWVGMFYQGQAWLYRSVLYAAAMSLSMCLLGISSYGRDFMENSSWFVLFFAILGFSSMMRLVSNENLVELTMWQTTLVFLAIMVVVFFLQIEMREIMEQAERDPPLAEGDDEFDPLKMIPPYSWMLVDYNKYLDDERLYGLASDKQNRVNTRVSTRHS